MIQLYKLLYHSSFLHYVGNKNLDEGTVISNSPLNVSREASPDLLNYFLKPFTENQEYYQLFHDSELNLNEVYTYVSKIFDDIDQLHEQSINLAKHLYNQSVHPKIKGGEFYTVYFKDCILDGDTVDAVGLFKSENKDTFLKVLQQDGNFNLESEKGINIKKLDKGCLIFNKEKENGYVVAVVDNTNKGIEAQYWIDDFLHIRSRKDEYSNTQNFMSLAKTFVTKELPKEFDVPKADQIDLLNKSLKFFKEKEKFDIEDFENTVIAQPEIIEKFHQFKKEYETSNDIAIDNQFSISDTARKKQQRSYKRVIRLDQQIQIIIDGNRENVEQGQDEKGKYYKVYYKEED
ncbi:nucleoid-associated protein [Porphyromonas pogonae]|uniref:nucleoid-associated protein n=1 Tax=Porphyromonas pogonae TaxID=867595 RepID=UPI002E75B338|nr:nucleoid-associated protein [Porphyromonas pogonae]